MLSDIRAATIRTDQTRPEIPLSNDTSSTPPSAAERSPEARIGAVMFRNRGWLPIPFLLVPLISAGTISPATIAVGLALMVLGESWRMWGVATAGPFAWSRNPLYVGNFLIWIGVITLSGVLWFIPVAILLFSVEYFYIVRYEEGVLETIFGTEYLEYKARTPRWFPRPPAGGHAGDFYWAEAWRSELSTFLQYAIILGLFYVKHSYYPNGVM